MHEYMRCIVAVLLGLVAAVAAPLPAQGRELSKIDLWTQGTVLRGVDIWQSKSYGVIDQVGAAHIGPAYTQEDFDALAAMGANLVNISHTGLFDENGDPDLAAAENLDRLLAMIQAADMFAVISLRTGPGRNEFTFVRDDAGDWFAPGQLDERVWTDQALQARWADMWRFTAERYKDNPIVAGYTLMVEPNANEVLADQLEEPWDPEEFQRVMGGTVADWNRWYPALARAVREVDPDTPILVSPDGYAAPDWLEYLAGVDEPGLVADIHPYEPFTYVFQEASAPVPWPLPQGLDAAWGDAQALVRHMAQVAAAAPLPVAALEFGSVRHAPDKAAYVRDMAAALEAQGMNHALWGWLPWGYSPDGDEFLLRRGPDPDDHADLRDSELLRAMSEIWAANELRPSNVTVVP